MQLKPIASNQTEVTTREYIILFSYETPVAYQDRATGARFRTDKKWSKTTTRHINKWLDGRTSDVASQAQLDSLT